MSTPNGTVIVADPIHGEPVDVTEAVQCLYDLVVQSMDFGSGFLTQEEIRPVEELEKLCGFGTQATKYRGG